ncbi:MAG: phosphatase PAP2 family protein [Aquabacterium sp.]|nr:phosphatase PAP2 family protein [Aquabacterium sp.]
MWAGLAPRRARQREQLAIAATAVVLCLVFLQWPQADLGISAWFYRQGEGFVGNQLTLVLAVYWAVPWLGRAAGLLALVAGVAGWRRCSRLGLRWWRRIVALGLVMLLGVGLLVNATLKEHWGRARPWATVQLGGAATYTPPLQPSAACARNCSFVSGHAATGFAVVAIGCLGAPHTRRRWWRAGLAAGLLVGAGRVLQGGHFLSDVLFAGLVIWATTAALRQGWLLARLRRQRRGRARSCDYHQSDMPASPHRHRRTQPLAHGKHDPRADATPRPSWPASTGTPTTGPHQPHSSTATRSRLGPP